MPVFEEMMAAARGDGVLDGAPAGAPVLVARRGAASEGCIRPHRARSVPRPVPFTPFL